MRMLKVKKWTYYNASGVIQKKSLCDNLGQEVVGGTLFTKNINILMIIVEV